jgi:hypothetical protein
MMIQRSVTFITCIVGGMIGGWLGWMASERTSPVRYYSTEVLNRPKPTTALRVKHNVWRDKACRTTVYRLIFDKEKHRFVVPDIEFPAGVLPVGDDTFVTMVPISQEAEAGPAVYRVVRLYRCNILHWIWPIEDGPHDIAFTIEPR